MFKNLKNQSGIGLVETMMGGAIVAIAAVGLGVSINSMARSTNKTKAVSNAVALESQVVGALQDPNTFAAYKNVLKNGQIDSFKSQFQVSLPGLGSGAMNLTARDNQPNYFTNSGATCSDYATNKDCLLKVTLQTRMISASPPSYGFAYKIETNPLAVNMVGLGVPGQIDNDDYKLLVPSSVYRDDVACEQGASGQIPFAARGFNFNTGQLTCWNAPTSADACPAGQFPSGLKVEGDRIAFTCTSLTPVGCNNGANGALYALSNFKPKELSSANGGIPSGAATCTFVAAPTVNALTGATGSGLAASLPTSGNGGRGSGGQWRYGVVGTNGNQWATFCPTGYKARIVTCEAVVADTLSPQPGRCPGGFPRNCAAETGGFPGSGVWFGIANPADYNSALVAPINVGTTQSNVNGNQAYCILNNGGQPAGAGWSGYVNMQVACDVNTDVYPTTVAPVVATGP